MNFKDELNNYLLLLNCSAKDLAESSGLSQSIISRYLSGKRTPRLKSEQFNELVNGLNIIAKNKNINISDGEIADRLSTSLSSTSIDFNNFVDNFNTLIR